MAIGFCLTCVDLAFALLGVNLETRPLPHTHTPDAMKVLPESMPWKDGGHNPRIFGHPWYLKNAHPLVPKQPSYPPHVSKGSSHFGPIRPLPAQSSSSNGPFRSLPFLNADASPNAGTTAKSSPAAKAKASSATQKAPVVNLTTLPGPAKVCDTGSRILLDSTPASGFTWMGWVDPVARWGRLTEDELHAYTLPFINMQDSRSRPEWHQCWVSVSTLRSWLLALEEHSFYLFAISLGHCVHQDTFQAHTR